MIIADLRWTVTAVLDGDKPKRLADARVTVMTDEAKGIGVEVMTDRYGRATFQLSDKVRVLDAVYVDPLHSGWPVALTWVPLAPGGMQVGVPCIDLSAADVRGLVYGKPRAGDGRGVRVGVVDTGVGPHPALKVEGGRNTTTEAVQRFRDEDGHGSHVAVAGVIAASAAGWRRGEASAVKLRAYRIFEAGDPYASNRRWRHLWLSSNPGPSSALTLPGLGLMWPGWMARCFTFDGVPSSPARSFTRRLGSGHGQNSALAQWL